MRGLRCLSHDKCLFKQPLQTSSSQQPGPQPLAWVPLVTFSWGSAFFNHNPSSPLSSHVLHFFLRVNKILRQFRASHCQTFFSILVFWLMPLPGLTRVCYSRHPRHAQSRPHPLTHCALPVLFLIFHAVGDHRTWWWRLWWRRSWRPPLLLLKISLWAEGGLRSTIKGSKD